MAALRTVYRLLRPRVEVAGFVPVETAGLHLRAAPVRSVEFRAGAGCSARVLGIYVVADRGSIVAELWRPSLLRAYVEGSLAPAARSWPLDGGRGHDAVAAAIVEQVMAWLAAAE
jgi:hypothetical protein